MTLTVIAPVHQGMEPGALLAGSVASSGGQTNDQAGDDLYGRERFASCPPGLMTATRPQFGRPYSTFARAA